MPFPQSHKEYSKKKKVITSNSDNANILRINKYLKIALAELYTLYPLIGSSSVDGKTPLQETDTLVGLRASTRTLVGGRNGAIQNKIGKKSQSNITYLF